MEERRKAKVVEPYRTGVTRSWSQKNEEGVFETEERRVEPGSTEAGRFSLRSSLARTVLVLKDLLTANETLAHALAFSSSCIKGVLTLLSDASLAASSSFAIFHACIVVSVGTVPCAASSENTRCQLGSRRGRERNAPVRARVRHASEAIRCSCSHASRYLSA